MSESNHLFPGPETYEFEGRQNSPLALYIHVPFCRQRCSYCHFDIKVTHPKTKLEPLVDKYVTALETEIATYAKRFPDRMLTSVFLGGGTPSRLSLAAMARILEAIDQKFHLGTSAEISVEANPEDMDHDKFQAWQEMGINRVSLGVQSFQDPSLKAIRRPHDGATAFSVLKQRPSFAKGCSMDLMLGLPFQNRETILSDLELLARLELEHVSVYMLERDLPTPLDKMANQMPMPSEDEQADDYTFVCEFLAGLGYQQYEISNFAKPGYTCEHNLVYWQCGDYLGLGPAASGRVGKVYWTNHPQLRGYCEAISREGHGRRNSETWSSERLRQEQLIQGLRLGKGVERKAFTTEEWQRLALVREADLVEMVQERLVLTQRGRLLANEVFQCLIPEDD